MIKLNFSPETGRQEFAEAADAYTEIWEKEGLRITEKLQELTGLRFQQDRIDVATYEGISQAGVFTPPMKLRSSYPEDVKLATLIHELSHHLMHDNELGINLEIEGRDLESHKHINLFLYDAWTDLYGADFAGRQVKVESARTLIYRQAWNWALGFSREERQDRFRQLKEQSLSL